MHASQCLDCRLYFRKLYQALVLVLLLTLNPIIVSDPHLIFSILPYFSNASIIKPSSQNSFFKFVSIIWLDGGTKYLKLLLL